MTMPATLFILMATLGPLPLAPLAARVAHSVEGSQGLAGSAASHAGLACCGASGQRPVCVCAGCCIAEAHESQHDGDCLAVGDPCGGSREENREAEVERVLAHLNTTDELLRSVTKWDRLQVQDFLQENGHGEIATKLTSKGTVMEGKAFAALMGHYDEVVAMRAGFKNRAQWSDLKVRLFSRQLGEKLSAEEDQEEADESPCEMFGKENVCEGYELYREKGLATELWPEPSWPAGVYSFVCEPTSYEEYEDLKPYSLSPDRDSSTALHLKRAVNFLVKEIYAYGTGTVVLGKSMFHCSMCSFCKLWKKLKAGFKNLSKRFKSVWHLVKASDSMSTKQKVWRTFMQEIAGNDPLLMSQASEGAEDKYMCQNFHGWQDADGLDCDDYVAPCREEERDFAVDGVSSWEACCACGGGYRNFTSFKGVSLSQIESEARMVSKALAEQDQLLNAVAEKVATRISLQVKKQLTAGRFGLTREVEQSDKCKKMMDPKTPGELRKFHHKFRIQVDIEEPNIATILWKVVQLEFISAVKSVSPEVVLEVIARNKEMGDCAVAPQKAFEDAAASCSHAHMGVCMVVAKQVMYTDLIRQVWPPLGDLGWMQRRRVLAELAETVSHSCIKKGGSELATASSFKEPSQEDLELNEAKEDCAFLADHVRSLLKPDGKQEDGPEMTDPHLPRAWYLALQQWSQSDSTKVVGDEVSVFCNETGTWHDDGVVIEVDKPDEGDKGEKLLRTKVKVEFGAARGEPKQKWFSQDDPDLKQNNPAFSMLLGVPVVEPFTRALCSDILSCNSSVARVSWHDIKETFNTTFGVENASAVRKLAVDEWTTRQEEDENFWPNQAGVGILRASRRLDSVFAARIKGFLSDNFRMSDLSPKALSLRSLPSRATVQEENLDPQAILDTDNKKRTELSMSQSSALVRFFTPSNKEKVEVWLGRDQQEQCPHIFHVPNCDEPCEGCELQEQAGSEKFSHVPIRSIKVCPKKEYDQCAACLRQQRGSLDGVNGSSDFQMGYILNCPHRSAEEFYSITHPVQVEHIHHVTLQAYYPARAGKSSPLQSVRLRFDAASDFALQRDREQWLQAIRESGRCWCACDTLRDFAEAKTCQIAVDPRLLPDHPKSELCLRGKHKDSAAVRCCRRDPKTFFMFRGAGDPRVNGAYERVGTHANRFTYANMKDPKIQVEYSESNQMWRVLYDDSIFRAYRQILYYAPFHSYPVPNTGWTVDQGLAPPPTYDWGLPKPGAPTGNETCAVDNASIERAVAMCQSRGLRLCSPEETRTKDTECPANNKRRVWTRMWYNSPKDYLQQAFKTGQFNDAVQRCLRNDDAVDT